MLRDEVNAIRLAALMALVAALFFALFGWWAGLGLAALLSGSLLGGLAMMGVAYYLLQTFLFRKLDSLHEEIERSLKKKVASRDGEGYSGTRRLQRSVTRLIREKTSEINSLKQLEQYRKEFLGNVAHELRSPIFNIQGYVYTLLEGALHDEAVNMKFLNKAATNIDHLSALVEDLVTISMIESGELVLEYSHFNLRELVREVMDLLDLQAKKRNITLQMKAGNGNSLYVYADRQKIRQVLVNLIGNSIKYGREGGHTTVVLQDMHQIVSVEVSDNGEGIAEENLPRIFERFYRVDKSRSRGTTSTGLGLSIVKHFVEAHKQKILVSSILGVGSIFSFTLEKNKPESKETA